jgi:hypothetical protein
MNSNSIMLFCYVTYQTSHCDGKGRCLLRQVYLFGRMVLETDASIIAGKVATHNMDADAPLSEQVMQLSIFLLAIRLLFPLINRFVDLNPPKYERDVNGLSCDITKTSKFTSYYFVRYLNYTKPSENNSILADF